MAQTPRNMLEQISDAKDLEISYRELHNKATISDVSSGRKIEIPFESLVNKYKHVLNDLIITVSLDDKLARYYLFKPKLLSQDLYGIVELWHVLLKLNNWTSISEFKPVTIKIYDPHRLKAFLNEILILEGKI